MDPETEDESAIKKAYRKMRRVIGLVNVDMWGEGVFVTIFNLWWRVGKVSVRGMINAKDKRGLKPYSRLCFVIRLQVHCCSLVHFGLFKIIDYYLSIWTL